jgi:DNA-binding MarR family transcriptional regulator
LSKQRQEKSVSKLEKRARELQSSIEELVHHFQAASTSSLDGDFSLQEIKLIDLVGQRESCIMREIADHLHVAVSTVTALVDKLERKEVVTRQRTDEDRRTIRVVLTKSGNKLFQSHVEELLKLCRGVLRSLDDDEQVVYLSLARKIATNSAQQFRSNGKPAKN